MRYFAIAALSASGVLFCSSSSQAETGFGLDRFDPAERGSHWFSADSLDIAGHHRWALGVVGDFAHDPLVLRDSNGDEIAAVIRDQFFLHPGAAVTLVDRLRFGLNLPVLVLQNASAVEGPNGPVSPSEDPAFGDLRASADVRLFGYANDPITLGVGVRLYFPTGDPEAFTSDGVFSMLMQAQVAGRGGSLLSAANFGLRARGRDENYGDHQVGSELVAGAALGFIAFDDRLVVGPEIWSSTVFSDGSHNFLNRPGTPVELTIGGHLEVVEDFRLGLGVGPGLTPGMGSPAVRYLFSLEWAPGREPAEPERPAAPRSLRDRDGDGIADGADQCPDVPGVVSSDRALNGCAATVYTDADGLADENDACPTLAGPAIWAPSA
jgi:hypothetical protein